MNISTIPRKEIARKELPKEGLNEPSPAHMKEIGTSNTVITWDAPEEGQSKRRHVHLGAGAGWAFSDRFDRIIPPHRRYFGRSRRTLLIAVFVAFVCLLGLIIGLVVGLSRKSK